eukprot:12022781-Heterocapsa_arctica.AAC.1
MSGHQGAQGVEEPLGVHAHGEGKDLGLCTPLAGTAGHEHVVALKLLQARYPLALHVLCGLHYHVLDEVLDGRQALSRGDTAVRGVLQKLRTHAGTNGVVTDLLVKHYRADERHIHPSLKH